MSTLLGFFWTLFIILQIKPSRTFVYSVSVWMIGMLVMAFILAELDRLQRRK